MDNQPAEMQPDTAAVTVTLIGYEAVAGGGAVIALAIVDIEIGGVALQLQGVRLVKRGGQFIVEPPSWRHPSRGIHIPSIVLPDVLAEAIGVAVIEAYSAKATGLPSAEGSATPPGSASPPHANPGVPWTHTAAPGARVY